MGVGVLRGDQGEGAQVIGHASLTRLRIPINKSETVKVDQFNDLLVGSLDIVVVVPLSNQEIYVLGKQLGTTYISVLDRDKRLLRLIGSRSGSIHANSLARSKPVSVGKT